MIGGGVSFRKKEIEANPYASLIDVSDLTAGVTIDEAAGIFANLQTMLLRHNSDLRNWYKLYSSTHENIIGTYMLVD